MIRAGHAVNAGIDAAHAVLPEVENVDLESTVARVVAWGGDPDLYKYFLAAASVTPANARSVATVAGWRSGVLGLRAAALDALAALGAIGNAALGLADADAAAFVKDQAADPFAWPGATREVATIGGFVGLGGPWLAPPTGPMATDVGRFRVGSGTETWGIEADVFGARVVRVGEGEPPARVMAHPPVTASVAPDSYFVTLVRS